jgi:putative ABC transport system permease protein
MTNLRLAIQRLCKTPGSSLAGILALALGIGLSGTMFSYVDLIYFKGQPFQDSKQVFNLNLVNVEQGNAKWYFPVSDFLTYREQQTTFTALGAVKTEPINISDVDGAPADYLSSIISVNTLDLLGVQPILGRGFLAEEGQAGAEPVCLIGKRLWENEFGASPQILEKHALINNRPHRILGVMAEGFGFPMMSDVWRPMVLPKNSELSPGGSWLDVFGRLKKDHSVAEAKSEFEVIAQRLEQENPETHNGLRAVAMSPFGEQMLGGGALQSMWLLVLASVGVLIIACANVANLLLVRSAMRAREMAVRAALGASRNSLIASVLIDSLTLAFIGAAGGIAVALIAIELLAYYHPLLSVPYWWIVEPNWRFFSLIIGLTAVVALLAGLFPTLRTTRFAVNDSLKENTSGAMGFSNGWLSRGLVVAQLAISCSLLGAAGMMVHNGMQMRNVDLPYDPSALLASDVRLPRTKFPTGTERRSFFQRLLTGLRSRPDVAHAALVSHRGVFDTKHDRITVEGHPEQVESERPPARIIFASQGYFDALGAPLIRGRDFRESDEFVAVINAPMAERMWPDEDPLGRRFRTGDEYAWLTVIGIAPDLQVGGAIRAHPGFSDRAGTESRFLRSL